MTDLDRELLSKAKSGDDEAIDKLLSIHKHLVVTISRKYFLIGGDSEDVIQEGMIGLFKAITTYDEIRGVSFRSYACKLIDREIISAIRHAMTHSQQVLSESLLVDSEESYSQGDSPESDFISEESTEELTKEIFEKLSSFERQVVEYYLKGYNYIDIAEMLGKSSKVIDNALTRIKSKLSYLKERL